MGRSDRQRCADPRRPRALRTPKDPGDARVVTFREGLPPNCPPSAAQEIRERQDVYRLVRTDPPTDDDFRSQRAEKPSHRFRDECRVGGLSVHTDRRDSERARRLPTLQGRLICRLRLDAGAGMLLQTGRPSHHTWWPLAGYDVLTVAAVESP